MLAMILPGTDKRAIPIQFIQSERPPILDNGSITLVFNLRRLSLNPKPCYTNSCHCCFTTCFYQSACMLSIPAALQFLRLPIALLTSSTVIGPVLIWLDRAFAIKLVCDHWFTTVEYIFKI